MVSSRVRRVTASSGAAAVAAAALTGLHPPGAVPLSHAGTAAAAVAARPNIVVIMTDDQDARSLSVMPNVKRLLARHGTSFANGYSNFPLCGPARASFLTGQYPHNHGVVGNAKPDGAYARMRHNETLPVWLKRAGYSTAHVGKYVNGYGAQHRREIPRGWDEWHGLVSNSTYHMWGYTLNENGRLRTYGRTSGGDPHLYQTDVLASKAVKYIGRQAHKSKPFFLNVATMAPHDEGATEENPGGSWIPPRPAPRHKGRFARTRLPRTPSFNEKDVSDKPRHIRALRRLNAQAIKKTTTGHRGRLESLLAVDDATKKIVSALERTGELNRTMIVFTSDNGFLEGQHRIRDKTHPYEASIRVPLIIRGPGIPSNHWTTAPAGTVDLPATILAAARARPGLRIDGRSLLGMLGSHPPRRDMLLETGPRRSGMRSYKAIRTDRYLYVEHTTGDRELYDLQYDSDEMKSLHRNPGSVWIRLALSRRLAQIRNCSGQSCP